MLPCAITHWGLRSTNSPLTWVTQRPGAVDEANVSREAGSEDAVGQRDQPAAPFVTPVLVATAEPRVEGEPGKQAAGYSQGQGEQHPATGTEAQNASEGLTFNISTTLWSISPAAIPALHVQGCFLMMLFAPDNFIYFFLQRNPTSTTSTMRMHQKQFLARQ